MPRRAWILLLAAVALGGCGGDPTLSASRAGDLHAQVAAVRDAAGKGDRAGALKALDELQADVRDLEAGGSLGESDADALRRGVGRARRRVRAEVAEPAPAPTPVASATAVPTATPEPPEAKPPKPPKAKGKGRGKKEKGEEDDD